MLDSQPVWLRAIENILASAGFAAVTTAASNEALSTLRRQRIAVFLIGIDGLPGWDRLIEAARRKGARAPKLVVVGGDEDPDTVERAFDLGADAYVAKRTLPEDVAFVVRQVLSPEVYEVRPTFAGKARDRSRKAPNGLTPREHEILGLVAQGRSNAEIARTLGISEPTVKGHLWRLFRKIGVANRTAAARWVATAQLLDRD